MNPAAVKSSLHEAIGEAGLAKAKVMAQFTAHLMLAHVYTPTRANTHAHRHKGRKTRSVF